MIGPENSCHFPNQSDTKPYSSRALVSRVSRGESSFLFALRVAAAWFHVSFTSVPQEKLFQPGGMYITMIISRRLAQLNFTPYPSLARIQKAF